MEVDLGNYLRHMRERIQPEDIGLVRRGSRRVPGLRREEVAALAGVSQPYYTRLEQSQVRHASSSVLLSIARALELSPDEQEYLLRIGTPEQARKVRAAPPDRLDARTRALLSSLGNTAGAVLDYRCDILAWNPLYHRLMAPHLDFGAPEDPATRPNVIKLNFLDENVRGLYDDWETESLHNVSYLRFIAAEHRDDPRFAELVGELTIGSREFVDLWTDQHVANCTDGVKVLNHPAVGCVELMYQTADLQGGHFLKLYFAEPDSPNDARLRLLTMDPGMDGAPSR
ncbi:MULTISPECIES: helix-turn-helix domain-containing protein [unclassified Nocardiopsis]|uniref:helix-turn-helix domain-containing protein n=1 Tax=unclassified Nocardiopsis TaxID=2649073 RepID=UPI001915C802|nr:MULTISPECIES: helix-turn-helix transcriptional regulator [unclassified Nocardiopsis]